MPSCNSFARIQEDKMKVTLKELNGTTWVLEIDENASVRELKEGIHREKGHPLDHQKLIYQGCVSIAFLFIQSRTVAPLKVYI